MHVGIVVDLEDQGLEGFADLLHDQQRSAHMGGRRKRKVEEATFTRTASSMGL